ncbi:DUF6611 family protein [Leifsonia sp. NPDC058248]|uniref:DUF6611 family protein n=1 Tax=Leifsonia sp. NPDC058248 TaxID=3346402 RepID=UPI0036D96B2A
MTTTSRTQLGADRHAAARLARTARVVLEGRHRWGYADRTLAASANRSGVSGQRLVVYPPGTNTRERRLLMAHRQWPVYGGLASLAVALVLSPATPGLALAGMLGLYVVGFAVLSRLTRRLRQACRSVQSSTVMLGGTIRMLGEPRILDACLVSLTVLEGRRDDGEIGEAEFELGWGEVYEALGARTVR